MNCHFLPLFSFSLTCWFWVKFLYGNFIYLFNVSWSVGACLILFAIFYVSSFLIWSSQCLLISFSQGHIFRLLTLSQFSLKLIHENILIKSFHVVILVLRFAYFMCMYVCYVYMCSMCLSFSRDARRGHKTHCELLCGCWDLNQVLCTFS